MTPPSLSSATSISEASGLSPLVSSKNGTIGLRYRLLLLMFAGDIAFAYLGLCLAYWLRFLSPLSHFGVGASSAIRNFADYQPVLALGVLFLVLGFVHQRIYDWKLLLRPRKLMPLTFKTITFWFLIYLCTSVVLKFEPQISRIFMLYAWGSVLVTVGLWKWLFTRLIQATGQTDQLAQRVLLAGWTDDSAELGDAIHGDENQPYQIIGWVKTGEDSASSAPNIYPLQGKLDELERVIQRTHPDILVVADLDLDRAALARIAKVCEIHYVNLKILPSMFQIFVSGLKLDTISGHPILGIEELPVERLTCQIVKRVIDIFGALVGLALSAPAIAVLAFLIKREDPSGSVFYKQTRSGVRGEPFTIYKLRSMRIDAESNGGAQWAQKDDPRRLRIGKFMRESNLDEVPQFWNVLKGDMSLVGPRPERPELIETFEREIDHYNHRHIVKPGITGWAQIHGLRGDTDLSERIRHDCYYIENWSIWLDIYCLVMTFFKRDNAY